MTLYGERWLLDLSRFTNVESLRSPPETNVMLYIIYTLIKNNLGIGCENQQVPNKHPHSGNNHSKVHLSFVIILYSGE